MATRQRDLTTGTPRRAAPIVDSRWRSLAVDVPWSRVQWVAGAASIGVLLLWGLMRARYPLMDFDVYRLGGLHVLGRGLYNTHTTIFGTRLLFTYTPFAAMLFWPISFLPVHAAEAVWDTLNVIGLVALLAVSVAAARRRKPQREDWRLAAILVAPVGLMLFPVYYDLYLGQINIFLVLMIVADLTMTLSLKDHRVPRGVLVGIAAAIKLTPLVFIPYLLLTRQRRAAFNATLTFVLATAAMFVVAPAASWAYWRKDAFDVARVGKPLSYSNQSIHALFGRAHLPTSGALIDLCLLITLCGGLAVAVIAHRKSSSMLGLLVCAAVALLVSPVSWWHHYVWIVPVLAWLAYSPDRPKRAQWWVAGVTCLFMIVPVSVHGLGPLMGLVHNDFVASAVAFIILAACMLWSRRQRVSKPALAELTS